MTNEMIAVAIRDYFRGERHEMLSILVGALALALLAIGLYVAMRDGFAKGFAGAVLLSTLLLAATAMSLLRRSPRWWSRGADGCTAPLPVYSSWWWRS